MEYEHERGDVSPSVFQLQFTITPTMRFDNSDQDLNTRPVGLRGLQAGVSHYSVR